MLTTVGVTMHELTPKKDNPVIEMVSRNRIFTLAVAWDKVSTRRDRKMTINVCNNLYTISVGSGINNCICRGATAEQAAERVYSFMRRKADFFKQNLETLESALNSSK